MWTLTFKFLLFITIFFFSMSFSHITKSIEELANFTKQTQDSGTHDVILTILFCTLMIILIEPIAQNVFQNIMTLIDHYHNLSIFHISVLNLLNMTFACLFLRAYRNANNTKPLLITIGLRMRIAINISDFLFLLILLLMGLLTLTWYVSIMIPEVSKKYKKCVKWLLRGIIYFYIFVTTVYSFGVSFQNGEPTDLSLTLLFVNISICVLFYVVVGVILLYHRLNQLLKISAVFKSLSLKIIFLMYLIMLLLFFIAVYRLRVVDYSMVTFLLLLTVQVIVIYIWKRYYSNLTNSAAEDRFGRFYREEYFSSVVRLILQWLKILFVIPHAIIKYKYVIQIYLRLILFLPL